MTWRRCVYVTFVVATCIASAALVGARGQSTARPGDPTQARVWIENRAPNEAVPVVIEALPSPVSVHIDASNIVHTASAIQSWEYRTVLLSNAANGSTLAIGNEGWEAVGVLQAGPGGATILFKRPR